MAVRPERARRGIHTETITKLFRSHASFTNFFFVKKLFFFFLKGPRGERGPRGPTGKAGPKVSISIYFNATF